MSDRARLEDRHTVTCKKCGYEAIDTTKAPAQKWLEDCPQCETLTVSKIKAEIARRIGRISGFDERDFSSEAGIHNRGVVSGLDHLWKWIQQSEGGD